MNFGKKLRELRKQHHYTQDDLARLTGFAKSTISMYENGQRKPSFEVLETFADHFNVDMNTLMGKQIEEQKESPPLSAREFMRIICQGDQQALAIVERLKLTDNGELEITGADLTSQAVLNHQIKGVISALKNAKLTDEGMMQFEYSPDKHRKE